MAIGVVVLGALAIILFFVPSLRLGFYIVTVVAILLGFYMAYSLSRSEAERAAKPASRRKAGKA